MSVKAEMESEGRMKDGVPPGGNVAMPTEFREVDVTLDPATAHPRLVLSEDQKSMRYGDTWQDLPNNPERFDFSFSALGSKGFTSGRHYWEMEVGPEGFWAIGVTRGSVRRKGGILLKPYSGIWALNCHEIPQCLQNTPRKIRVCLNYERGEVRFYNVENEALISSLTAELKGKVVPFFHLWAVGSHIKLLPSQR
ncbi:E3 ubiquitin-protein ligase TRIM58-like [Emydura macquarii macquarii]|uniref:E3 ubiquitin-protein ligase TRIM58-like n=1 Tax=Emydura macquarii macquarii TaxID=1129001 RepID=UPI00352A811D